LTIFTKKSRFSKSSEVKTTRLLLYCTADSNKVSPALPFIPITFDISYHRFSVVKLITYIPSTLTPSAFTFPFNTEEVDFCAKAAVVRNIIKVA
jgi:hypothetical protein